jgi:hypothetical protein
MFGIPTRIHEPHRTRRIAHVWRRIFLEHPASVGETYREHQRIAAGFGFKMVAGGVACLFHALIPAAFVVSGSRTVEALHDRMARRRQLSVVDIADSAGAGI